MANVEGNLNVRAAAGTDADVVGKMPNNAGCEILGVEGEWTQIKSGSVEGYVKSEYLLTGDAALARADEVKQTLATVTTTTLYVREQPNTDCAVVTMMPQGEELEVQMCIRDSLSTGGRRDIRCHGYGEGGKSICRDLYFRRQEPSDRRYQGEDVAG